ncbi:hypothetical protein [Citrobacter sp. R56]|uniref:hypothetical protein n=1 Tax=Citrobacter sp. R56 TaxID=1573676 RepID=UPI001EEF3D81|nr:hypothetical protein [Citrobacter sp. R56]
MQSDKRMAVAVTKALCELHASHMETVKQVKLGAQRFINYGSYLIPGDDYRSTCYEQWQEDKRFFLCFSEMYKRNDVVLDIAELYFRKNLNRLGEKKSFNLVSFIKKKIGDKSHDAAVKSSKLAISLSILMLIIDSAYFQESHINMVNNMSTWFVKGAAMYSKIQIEALAANRLKLQDAAYYQSLRNEKPEMLYFLIEPQMSTVIYQVESGGNNEKVVADVLYEMHKQ